MTVQSDSTCYIDPASAHRIVPASASSSKGFLTAFGQHDSHALILASGARNHSPAAGRPYSRIGWSEILRLAKAPGNRAKDRAQFVIPSIYVESDGRTHLVQREHGLFGLLSADIDSGDHDIEAIEESVSAAIGDAEMLIYSSSSAQKEQKKWRIMVPMAELLPGADFAETQTAFFALLSERGIRCDLALARAAQPVFLPNVPPEKRRPEDGTPLFYQTRHHPGPHLLLGPTSPIIRKKEELRAAREREAEERRSIKERRSLEQPRHIIAYEDEFDPIAHFNANNDIADLLNRYGFERCLRRRGSHWKSPLSESGSFSTEIRDDHWVCVSSWPHNYDIGRVTSSGNRAGDAFDLYAYFEHYGDKTAAVRAYAQEVRPRRQSSHPLRTKRGRFTGLGAVACEPPEIPDFFDAEKVGQKLNTCFRDALNKAAKWKESGKKNTPPVTVMKASPGSGKTSAMLSALAAFDIERLKGDVVIYMPTLRLATEAAAAAEALEIGWHVTRGRGAINPETDEPMCARAELAAETGRAGLSIKATLCERILEDSNVARCPWHAICNGERQARAGEPRPGYLKQWRDLEDGPVIRFETHAYLQRGSDGSGRGIGLRIVDEKVWQSFVRLGFLPLEDLLHAGVRPPPRGRGHKWAKDYAERAALAADRQKAGREVAEAFRAAESPVLAHYSEKDFADFAKDEDRRPTILTKLPNARDEDLAEDIALARLDRDTAGLRAMLWKILKDAKAAGRTDTERLKYLPAWQGANGEKPACEAVHLRWLAGFPDDVPTILLDADADPEIVDRMHSNVVMHEIEMAPNAEIVQVEDRVFSNKSLIDGGKLRAECVGVIRSEVVRDKSDPAGPRGVLVVANKSVVRRFFEDAGILSTDQGGEQLDSVMLSTALHGAAWLWYGPGSLGLNIYENYGTVIAIGREEMPFDALEDLGCAVFGDTEEPLQLIKRDETGITLMEQAEIPYLMADGTGRAARVPVHPDPRIRALQQQVRECGLRQAIERLRLARARVCKKVMLLTKIPLPGFPVTRLVNFDEIAPPRLIAALLEARGVLRLSAAGLAEDAPTTFPTAKSAERWLAREGREQVNTPAPLLESYYPSGGINSVLAQMRLPGQRGPKPTPVLVATPQKPHAALTQRFGKMAEFTVLQQFMSDGCAAQSAGPASFTPAINKNVCDLKNSSTALAPPEAGNADSPSRISTDVAQEGDASPAYENLQGCIVSFPSVEDSLRGVSGIPRIKPHSAAAKVLLAIDAGNKTPGAISTSTALGYKKTHLSLLALKRVGMLREERDGTFTRL